MLAGTKKLRISAGEALFYGYWIIMLTLKALGFQEGMLIYNAGLVISFGCIMLKAALEKHSLREWILILLLLAVGGMIYLSSREKAPLIYIMLVIGMKQVPVKRVFRIGLPIWVVCFAYRTLATVTGLQTGYVFAHEKLGLGPILRWDFGYAHPNVLQISYAVLAAFLLYQWNGEGKGLWKRIGLLFLGNCYIFLYSVSYTGVILNTLFLVIFCYFAGRKHFTGTERLLMQCILPFCVIFSIAGPLLTEKGMPLHGLDGLFHKLFNTRFLASRIYLYRGLSLFGRTQEQLDITFALDCSYVSLLVRHGVIFFILVLAGYAGMIHRYIKEERRKKLAIIFSFLIAGISEPFLFNVSFKNLLFVFLGEYLYDLEERLPQTGPWMKKTGTDFMEKSLEISVPDGLPAWTGVKRMWKEKKGRICVAGLTVGVLAASACHLMSERPDSIYVDVVYTDCAPQEEKYLDMKNLPENFNSLVYNYQGPDMPLYEFSGNMIKLEALREFVSRTLIGGVIAGGVILLAGTALEKGRDRENAGKNF